MNSKNTKQNRDLRAIFNFMNKLVLLLTTSRDRFPLDYSKSDTATYLYKRVNMAVSWWHSRCTAVTDTPLNTTNPTTIFSNCKALKKARSAITGYKLHYRYRPQDFGTYSIANHAILQMNRHFENDNRSTPVITTRTNNDCKAKNVFSINWQSD